MVMGPGGILEILIALTGYDNLCLMLYDEPELVGAHCGWWASALCAA